MEADNYGIRLHGAEPREADELLDAFADILRESNLDKGLEFHIIHEGQPVGEDLVQRVDGLVGVVQFALLHVADDIEAGLLHVIHEVHQMAGGGRPGDEQQDLGTPVFDMLLSDVQEEEILSDLVVDEGLGDGTGGDCGGLEEENEIQFGR